MITLAITGPTAMATAVRSYTGFAALRGVWEQSVQGPCWWIPCHTGSIQGDRKCMLTWAVTLVVMQCHVVLQIGLAVGDIAEVQKHALLKRIAMQVSVAFVSNQHHPNRSHAGVAESWEHAAEPGHVLSTVPAVHVLWCTCGRQRIKNEKKNPTTMSAEELRNCLSLLRGQHGANQAASRCGAGGCGERQGQVIGCQGPRKRAAQLSVTQQSVFSCCANAFICAVWEFQLLMNDPYQ